jgi:hypothetical protein
MWWFDRILRPCMCGRLEDNYSELSFKMYEVH